MTAPNSMQQASNLLADVLARAARGTTAPPADPQFLQAIADDLRTVERALAALRRSVHAAAREIRGGGTPDAGASSRRFQPRMDDVMLLHDAADFLMDKFGHGPPESSELRRLAGEIAEGGRLRADAKLLHTIREAAHLASLVEDGASLIQGLKDLARRTLEECG